jgi:methionyl-tRNA formyltransferase
MKIVFMGTPAAAVPTLERLLDDGHEIVAVYTQPDRPSGRGNKITFSPVKEFALANGLKVLQPTKVRTQEAFDEFSSLAADVAVVVAYGRILPESFLNAFPLGAVNVHFSLLPKYRGAAPVNWAIVNGESETGVTTMKMDAGLDTGAILMQSTTPIGNEETSVELMGHLAITGADLLSQTLSQLDGIEAQAQDDTQATYAPIMRREDGMINWSMSAADIASRVRGFQPFPTAFTQYRGQKLTIWKARASDDETEDAKPGQVVDASGDSLLIQTGSGVLEILELQLEGKRRMSTRELLNGTAIAVGEILGQ